MTEFLDAILAFPTVLFTIPMGVVLCYWLTVMLGAVSIDILDVGDLEGGAKAAAGALEGGAKAAAGALEGGEGVEAGAKSSAGLFEWLGLGGVPVTVSFSVVVFLSWLSSLLVARPAQAALGGVLPGALLSGVLALLCLAVGVGVGSRLVRPLRPLFEARQAPRRAELMGRVCIINSGRVDARFGQATFEDGGAGLILNVHCERPNQLKRGDQALIIGYDPGRDTYEVEPVDWLLPEELGQLQDPTRAAAIARARAQTR